MSNQCQSRAKSTLTKTISAKVESGVCRQALRYAELRGTKIAVIIEEALVAYMKSRAAYLPDVPS